jgi:hypothetical protein
VSWEPGRKRKQTVVVYRLFQNVYSTSVMGIVYTTSLLSLFRMCRKDKTTYIVMLLRTLLLTSYFSNDSLKEILFHPRARARACVCVCKLCISKRKNKSAHPNVPVSSVSTVITLRIKRPGIDSLEWQMIFIIAMCPDWMCKHTSPIQSVLGAEV